jgi:hypothetical protein
MQGFGGVVWEGGVKGHRSAVRVFTAQAAVVEHHVSTVDVIAESPPAKSKAVLALSLSEAFQCSDAVLTTPVVQVGAKHGKSICIGCSQLSVTSGEGPQEPVKARRGTNRARWRHAF